jgi:hypothetical protein
MSNAACRLGQRFDSRDQRFVCENVRSQPFLHVNREQHTAVAVEARPGYATSQRWLACDSFGHVL